MDQTLIICTFKSIPLSQYDMNHKTTISDIFSPRKNNFAVPNYQRAYSWEVGTEEDRQVVQFLSDLKEHPESVPQYHLGHFLFEQDLSDRNKFWIIDGQQRMTTLIIFMSCIYQKMIAENAEDKEAANLYSEYLINTDGQQKFYTVDYDNNYLLNLLIYNQPDEEKTKSRKRIQECQNYFQREINKANFTDVLRWKQLIENAKITTDTIEDKAEATQIFTFQNDRGKELTNLEKLKAFLMLQIYLSCKSNNIDPNNSIRYVEKEFEAIYQRIEQLQIADEDQVLNYHVTAFVALAGSPVERVKNAFSKVPTDQKQKWINDFSVNLKRSFEKTIIIQTYLIKNSYIPDVLYLDQPNSMPLLLKLFNYHDIGSVHEKTFRLIEIILFRCKYTTGNYYSNYLPNLSLAYNGDLQQLNSDLKYYASHGFKDYWSFEGSFHQYLNGDNHYFGLSRYLLWKFENELRKEVKESPMLFPEFSNLYGTPKFENTIDHWAPQNPYEVEYEQEFNTKFLHNIGNMVLSTRSRNASDSNKLPEERSTFSVLISRQKLELLKTKWGKEEIKKRQEEIVAFAMKYWNPGNII